MAGLSSPARTIALMRLAVGVSSWVAPNLVARLFAVDPAANPNAPYIMRLFAVRDAVLALGVLLSDDEGRKLWLRLGMVTDAADVAAAGAGVRGEHLSTTTGLLGGAAAIGGVTLGASALAAEDSASV